MQTGTGKKATGLGGFEPPTSGLEARRSVLAKPQALTGIMGRHEYLNIGKRRRKKGRMYPRWYGQWAWKQVVFTTSTRTGRPMPRLSTFFTEEVPQYFTCIRAAVFSRSSK